MPDYTIAVPKPDSSPYLHLKPGQVLACGLGLRRESLESIELSKKEVMLWTRAAEAMKKARAKDCKEVESSRELLEQSHGLVMRSQNLGDFIQDNKLGRLVERYTGFVDDWSILLLYGLPIVYGSIHLAAWNSDFPTNNEEIMWKVACFIVVAGLPILAGTFLIKAYVLDIFSSRFTSIDPIGGFLVWGTIWIMIAVYICSRVFLSVESFVSVPSLPLGVFITIGWSDYIPHL
jgi:hypothetical protein